MYDYKNKKRNIEQQVNLMLSRSYGMFKYEGLPDTLPELELEKVLQRNGMGLIGEYEGSLYIFKGALGGEQDVYGNYKTYTVTNPYVNFSKDFLVGTDGVIIKNDPESMGLTSLYEKYAFMMVENDISMVISSYNNRIQTLFTTADNSTKESADLFLKNIIKGELGTVGENRIFDGLKFHTPQANANTFITQLIEYQQYLKGSLYNEIGLNANYNMKRERLSSGETDLNVEALYPLIDSMLECRKSAIDKVNEMFGTEISVEFNGVWKKRQLEVLTNELMIEQVDDGDVLVDDMTQTTNPENIIEIVEGVETGNEQLQLDNDPEPDNLITELIEVVDDVVEVVADAIEELESEVDDNEQDV